MDGEYAAMRAGIIEFVELLDKLLRLAPNAMLPDETTRIWLEVVVEAASDILAEPAIHKLVGRVREASPAEIRAAAQALIDISGQDGLDTVQKMSAEAAKADQTWLATALSEIQDTTESRRNGTS